MTAAAVNSERVMCLVRGMTLYTSRIYNSERYQEQSSNILIEDLLLPKRLKITISDCLDTFMNVKYVYAHNYYADMEKREYYLRKSFRAGLLEMAKAELHEVFLRECVLYIISATELERLDFPEANNIVMDAIYHACMNSIQYEELLLWETTERLEQRTPESDDLNNENDQHDYDKESNDRDETDNDVQDVYDLQQNDDTAYSSDVEVIFLGMEIEIS